MAIITIKTLAITGETPFFVSVPTIILLQKDIYKFFKALGFGNFDCIKRADLRANAASFAIIKIRLQPFSVFYLYSIFWAVKGA